MSPCIRMRGCGVLARVLTLGALVLGLGAGQALAAPAAGVFGVCSGNVLNLSPAQRDAQLQVMAANGLSEVRQDASWSTAEPQAPDTATGAHAYDWTEFDRIAGELAAQGLRWYPILDYSTTWSASIPGDVMSAPQVSRVPDFAAYARAFALRYGPSGSFWAAHPELPTLPVAAYEIWNEPNAHTFWRQQETAPEQYADLYAAARTAIRTADTSTPVVVGGLLDANATDPNVFVRRMVAHRPALAHQMDAVGYHPYQQSYAGILSGVRRIRATLNRLGATTTPLELSELGISTSYVPEPRRAGVMASLAKTLTTTASLRVSRFIPYAWQGAITELGDWSLTDGDGTLRPTAIAYLAVAKAAGARTVTATARPRVTATAKARIALEVMKRAAPRRPRAAGRVIITPKARTHRHHTVRRARA